ncbi:MAG: hypothetical protein J5719_05595 [Bacteroidales bacterium]|nr:hypothetical protein [Bacteroidales bacterium]
MKIEFVTKKKEKIKCLHQWPRPMKENQWQDGRSAKEMAKFAICHTEKFLNLIKRVLSECKIDEQDFECEPEAVAGLGKGMKSGGSRHHDILMKGNSCVIGVEAKVSELFSEKNNIDIPRALALWDFFCKEEKKEDEKIGYQLFTATRATMNSAVQLRNAIQLIIVFTGDVKKEPNYDDKYNKNEEAFNYFLEVTKAENGLIEREIDGKSVKCWIKKVKVRLPDYSFEK